mgnify:CR=1 FL=1
MSKSYGVKVLKKAIKETKNISKKEYDKIYEEAKKREKIVIYNDKDIDKKFEVFYKSKKFKEYIKEMDAFMRTPKMRKLIKELNELDGVE